MICRFNGIVKVSLLALMLAATHVACKKDKKSDSGSTDAASSGTTSGSTTSGGSMINKNAGATQKLNPANQQVNADFKDKLKNKSAKLRLTSGLTDADFDAIADAGSAKIVERGHEEAGFVVAIPDLLVGAEGYLSEVMEAKGLTSDDVADVIVMMAAAGVELIGPRKDDIAADTSADDESDDENFNPLQTVLHDIGENMVGYLDEAGIVEDEATAAIERVSGALVGALNDAGVDDDERASCLYAMTVGMVEGLGDIAEITEEQVGGSFAAITRGSLNAVDDLEEEGMSLAQAEQVVNAIVSGCIGSIDKIGLEEITSDDVGVMMTHIVFGGMDAIDRMGFETIEEISEAVAAVAAISISTLDEVHLEGFDNSDISNIVAIIVTNVVGNLDLIEVEGYDADDLVTVMTQVINDSIAAVGDIDMPTALTSDDLEGILADVSEGAFIGLANLEMEGFDEQDAVVAIAAIATAAVGSLDSIDMEGIDADDIAGFAGAVVFGMMSSIDSLGDDFTSSDIAVVAAVVIQGAINGLDMIAMEGFDGNDMGNTLAFLTAAAVSSLDKIELEGFDADDLGVVVGVIAATAMSHVDDIEFADFDAADYGAVIKKIASAAVSNLDNVDLSGFDASDLATVLEVVAHAMVGSLDDVGDATGTTVGALAAYIGEGLVGSIDNLAMDGFDVDDVASLVQGMAKGSVSGLADVDDVATLDASAVISAIGSVMTGMNTGLGQINMSGFDSSKINTMQASMVAGVKLGGAAILSDFSGLTQSAVDNKADAMGSSLTDPSVSYDPNAASDPWNVAD